MPGKAVSGLARHRQLGEVEPIELHLHAARSAKQVSV
jgi:hypothetical protein